MPRFGQSQKSHLLIEQYVKRNLRVRTHLASSSLLMLILWCMCYVITIMVFVGFAPQLSVRWSKHLKKRGFFRHWHFQCLKNNTKGTLVHELEQGIGNLQAGSEVEALLQTKPFFFWKRIPPALLNRRAWSKSYSFSKIFWCN